MQLPDKLPMGYGTVGLRAYNVAIALAFSLDKWEVPSALETDKNPGRLEKDGGIVQFTTFEDGWYALVATVLGATARNDGALHGAMTWEEFCEAWGVVNGGHARRYRPYWLALNVSNMLGVATTDQVAKYFGVDPARPFLLADDDQRLTLQAPPPEFSSDPPPLSSPPPLQADSQEWQR